MKKLSFIIIVFIFMLVVKIPASQVLLRLSLPQAVELSGINGTIWAGSIDNLFISPFSFGKTSWVFNPISLFKGQVELQISNENTLAVNQLSINGIVAIDANNIVGSNITVITDANAVFEQFSIPLPARAEGKMYLELDHFHLEKGMCKELSGRGEWAPALLQGDIVHKADFGKFEVDLLCEHERLLTQFNEKNALNLKGQAWISSNGRFGMKASFKPKPSLPNEVHKAAYLFGKPNARGVFRINFDQQVF